MCISNQNLRGGQYRLLNGADENKKIHTVELSTFSNNLHEAIIILCYSQELSKKICTIFSMRSCPGTEF